MQDFKNFSAISKKGLDLLRIVRFTNAWRKITAVCTLIICWRKIGNNITRNRLTLQMISTDLAQRLIQLRLLIQLLYRKYKMEYTKITENTQRMIQIQFGRSHYIRHRNYYLHYLSRKLLQTTSIHASPSKLHPLKKSNL